MPWWTAEGKGDTLWPSCAPPPARNLQAGGKGGGGHQQTEGAAPCEIV